MGRIGVLNSNGVSTLSCLADEVRPAKNFQEVCQAYRLAHDRYTETGLMLEKGSRMRVFLRDLLPTSKVFVAIRGNTVIGTTSGNIYGPGSLPLADLYSEQLGNLVAQGRYVAEGTKLACAEVTTHESRSYGGLSCTSVELLRWLFRWCVYSAVTDWMIVVHPRLRAFYVDDLGFEQVGGLLPCPHVSNSPGILLRLDIEGLMQGKVAATSITNELFLSTCSADWNGRFQHEFKLHEAAALLLDDLSVYEDASKIDRTAFLKFFSKLNINRFQQLRSDSQSINQILNSKPLILTSLFNLEASDGGVECGDRLEYRPVCFALRSFLSKLQIFLEIKADEQGLSVNLSVADSVPDTIVGDPSLLGRLIVKLIDSIDCSKPSDNYNSISANSAEVQIHIDASWNMDDSFDLGVSVWASHKVHYGELKSFLEVMSGELISSTSVAFVFKIPVMKVEAAPQLMVDLSSDHHQDIQKKILELVSCGKTTHILIVEDNLVNQFLVKKLLSKVNLNADTATDGEEALEKIMRSQYDLILLDIQLPKISGFDIAQTVRRHEVGGTRKAIIYAMTSFVMREDYQRCIEAGMDGHLAKPIGYCSLLEVVYSALTAENSSRQILNL